MKFYWFAFLVIFITPAAFAQPQDAKIEVVEGKKYYVHIVQGGNTLWGIYKLYNVPVDEIIKSNPGVENGVKEGQRLLIPVPNSTVSLKDAGEQKKHTVNPQETLFGIAKKYGITVDELVQANPGIENGVKVGQVLIIPEGSTNLTSSPVTPDANTVVTHTQTATGKPIDVTFSDTIIEHIVLPHETLYSISKRFMVPVEQIQKLNSLKSNKVKNGDVLKIPIKNEKVEEVTVRPISSQTSVKTIDSTLLFPKKEKYTVAILLPFFLDKQDANTRQISELATEFYMGAKIALDSLESFGLKAKVCVFDTKNDTASVKAVLAKKEMMDVDVVIGPLFPDKMGLVADWCKKHKVRYVCPTASNTSILKNNQFVSAAIPSEMTLMEETARFLLKSEIKDQIILVKPTNSKDQLMYDAFRQAFMSLPSKGARPKLIEANLTEVKGLIKRGVNTYFVVPTNEKSTALKFMNTLNASVLPSSTAVITVLGTKEWIQFDEIKAEYKNKYNFQFPSANDFNYSYENTKNVMKIYRRLYNADLTKMGAQGFDVTYYFLAKFLLNKDIGHGVMTDFELYQKGGGNGFENSNIYILKQQDYELIKIYQSNE